METLENSALVRETVHVWRVPLSRAEDERPGLLSLLSDEERGRLSLLRFPADRSGYLHCHAALRLILSSYANARPQDVAFRCGNHGKPFIVEPLGARCLEFNLSHSRSMAIIVVAIGKSLGVDVEEVRRIPDQDLILERYFDAHERDFVHACGPFERSIAFLRIWTRHEAVAKCLGLDISTSLETLSIPRFEPGTSVAFSPDLSGVDLELPAQRRLRLQDLPFETPHVGSLCCEDGPWHSVYHELPLDGDLIGRIDPHAALPGSDSV